MAILDSVILVEFVKKTNQSLSRLSLVFCTISLYTTFFFLIMQYVWVDKEIFVDCTKLIKKRCTAN